MQGAVARLFAVLNGITAGLAWPVVALGALAAIPAMGQSAHARERAPVVRVREGWLEGVHGDDGLDRYLGVPYAAAPVGAWRWRAPQPAARWRGVRSAATLPARCAQVGAEGPGSEDCLYLNLFVPPHRGHAGRLPVLFYIHGGSFRVGSSWDNDPSRIARETNSLVVMVNYRLGMLGFLAHPALNAEAGARLSGNYGFMDQQAALRWVHDEIEAFGGDPDNITIAGGSAGASSVCAHLTSSPSRGLFARAVLQSGDCYTQSRELVESTGQTFAAAAGCADSGTLAACLRGKSTAEILATDSWNFEAALVSGGSLIPEPTADAVAAGRFARVPIVYGFTENELRNGIPSLFPMSQADYDAYLAGLFGSQVDAVKSLYPSSAYSDPYYAFVDAIDDSGVFGGGSCIWLKGASTFAQYVPTYVYEFDDASAPNPSWVTAAAGFVSGASHGSDEVYWFDRPTDTIAPLNAAQRALAREMVKDLGAFTRGTPLALHSARWPRFDATHQRLMRYRIGKSGVSTTFAAENHCEQWRALGFDL